MNANTMTSVDRVERKRLMGLLREPAAARYQDGMNLYEFVRSSPVMLVDPFGLQSNATTAPTPAPNAQYIQSLLSQAEGSLSNCWLYQAAGIDKLFNKLKWALSQNNGFNMIPPGGTASGTYQSGSYGIPASGYSPGVAVHETVHAYNYWMGYHQDGLFSSGLLDDEGMAWGVQNMLDSAKLLCASTSCKDCNQAQKLWDQAWNIMSFVEGAASGTTNNPGQISATNIWDVNAKLGLHFSQSALKSDFEAALRAKGFNCSINVSPKQPQKNAPPRNGQPDPFG